MPASSMGGFSPTSPTALLAAATSFMPPKLRDVVDEGGRLSRAVLALEQLGLVAGEVSPQNEWVKPLLVWV